MMLVIVLGYLLLGVFQVLDKGKGRAPKLEFRDGYWVLLWFAGITIISYLGKYSGTTATHAGQLNLLGFTGGILANLGLTIVIMAIAWTCQLPSDRVRQLLAESGHPERADPAE